MPPTPDYDPTPWTGNEGGKRPLAAGGAFAALPGLAGAESPRREVGKGVPGGLTFSCSMAGSLPRGAGKHEACSIHNVFGFFCFCFCFLVFLFLKKTDLKLLQTRHCTHFLFRDGLRAPSCTGRHFPRLCFTRWGERGWTREGGWGEREKKRNRGKEGTPAGRAEGEAEAKLGWGAAAPARACGRARVTRRAPATRVPRRPAAAAAAAALSSPGSALAGPLRCAARGWWVQPEPQCAPASLCASLAQPLFACLCASPRQSPPCPGSGGGVEVARSQRARRPPARSSAAPRRSPFQARSSRPSLVPFPPFGTPSPSHPSHPPPRLTAWARLAAPPASPTLACVSPVSSKVPLKPPPRLGA